MKNLLCVASSTAHFSGAEWSLFRLANEIKERINIRFLMPDRGDLFRECRKKGIPTLIIQYIPTGRRALSLPRILPYIMVNTIYAVRFIFHILRFHIHIVHVNEIYTFPALIAAKIAGAKTVCHVRAGVLPSRFMKRITLFVVNLLSDRVVYVSHGVRKTWYGEAQPGKKSTVMYNIHPDQNKFDPSCYSSRKEKPFIVGMVSKICKEKGHSFLIDAARIIAGRGITDIEYSVVGGPLKGHEEYNKHILSSIRTHGLDGRFRMIGMQTDVPAELAEMDLFVHVPEYEDPFPTVVLEAMMMEKPVICFDVGGIREQFENGVSGVLVPKGNIEQLADEIIALYNDPQRRRYLGENARKHVLKNLAPSRIAGQIMNIYNTL